MKILLLFISIFIGFPLYSQNTGLYSKRFSVEADFIGSYPLFFRLLDENHYKASGSNVVLGNDNFDYGFRLAASYAMKNNFGMGIEYGKDFLNIEGPVQLSKYYPLIGYNENVYLQHEMIKIETTTIMPKIEFTSHNGLLPVGLNHQIGFGFTSTQLIEDDYVYRIGEYSSPIDIADFEKNFYNYDSDPIKGYTILYALNVRTPINKSLMLSYGFRYTFNITPNSEYIPISSYDETFWLKQEEAIRLVKMRRRFSFIYFNLGLALAL